MNLSVQALLMTDQFMQSLPFSEDRQLGLNSKLKLRQEADQEAGLRPEVRQLLQERVLVPFHLNNQTKYYFKSEEQVSVWHILKLYELQNTSSMTLYFKAARKVIISKQNSYDLHEQRTIFKNNSPLNAKIAMHNVIQFVKREDEFQNQELEND